MRMNIHIITFKNLSNFGIIDMQWLDQIAINYFLGIETIKLVENTKNTNNTNNTKKIQKIEYFVLIQKIRVFFV